MKLTHRRHSLVTGMQPFPLDGARLVELVDLQVFARTEVLETTLLHLSMGVTPRRELFQELFRELFRELGRGG